MLQYLLFIFYALLLSFCLVKIPFIKQSALSTKMVLVLWLIKIAASIFIGWVSGRYYHGNDYLAANFWGLQEHMLLMNDPATFFADIFQSNYPNGYSGFFNGTQSYWNDLSNNIIYKFLGITNIFTRGNYYLNSLFFNALAFLGPVALYRVYIDVYPKNKWLVIAGCFLVPSTLLYTSGIHKDAVVFAALSLFCYAVYFSLKNGFILRRIALMFMMAFVLLLIRNFVLLAICPALFAWVLSQKNKKILTTFAATYLLAAVLLIAFVYVSPKNNPLTIVSNQQINYRHLKIANTQLKLDSLPPTISGFVQNAPAAIQHSFMRPSVWDFPGTPWILFAMELLAFKLLFLITFIYQPTFKFADPVVLFGICVAITLFIFIGFVVPNVGAISRYRSLYLPFFILPLLIKAKFIYINLKNNITF